MEKLEKILDELISGSPEELADADITYFLTQSISDLEEAADTLGESLDYGIEAALEQAASREMNDLANVIESHWLTIDYIPNGTIYEVVVRCAEFLADYHMRTESSLQRIKELAESDDWRNRLVAAWYLRSYSGDELENEREKLAEDPFMDDNGNYLVREGLGESEDDMFS